MIGLANFPKRGCRVFGCLDQSSGIVRRRITSPRYLTNPSSGISRFSAGAVVSLQGFTYTMTRVSLPNCLTSGVHLTPPPRQGWNFDAPIPSNALTQHHFLPAFLGGLLSCSAGILVSRNKPGSSRELPGAWKAQLC
jgi:hypothetical protein